MKYLLNYRYREHVYETLELAVLHVVQDTGPEDLLGYFRHTNYLNVRHSPQRIANGWGISLFPDSCFQKILGLPEFHFRGVYT